MMPAIDPRYDARRKRARVAMFITATHDEESQPPRVPCGSIDTLTDGMVHMPMALVQMPATTEPAHRSLV